MQFAKFVGVYQYGYLQFPKQLESTLSKVSQLVEYNEQPMGASKQDGMSKHKEAILVVILKLSPGALTVVATNSL